MSADAPRPVEPRPVEPRPVELRPVEPAPDRLLARACRRVLVASLAIVAAGQAVDGWVVERNARAAVEVAATAAEAARASAIAGRLERLAEIEPGPAHRIARTVLADEIAMLAEASGAAREDGDTRLLLGARSLLANGAPLTAAEAERLHATFASSIAPARHAQARLAQRRAAAMAIEGRILIWGSAFVQILALLAVGAGLLAPALRRTRESLREAAAAADAARRRLLHDALTGLPNAASLSGVLGRLIADAGRRGSDAAAFLIDLDRLATLRDALGQRTAAEIARLAARRMQQCLRGSDFAAHLGLERFVVVATDLAGPGDAVLVGQRLHAALCRPYAVPGGTRRIAASIGVALLSDDEPDAERLLGNAEIALGKAQRGGGGSIRYFNESMRAEAEAREMLSAEILAGLEADAFVPHFQPQLRLATGEFIGFEALARWNHPERGVLWPRDFLDAAEQADLVKLLGERLIVAVLDALVRWDAAGLVVPSVGVNFALAQLHDPGLIERIKWEVDRRELAPSRLAIEVLETVLVKSDADAVVRNLRGLASAGFRIDLDDFGTGHASISNLRRFMATRIKIDRSFVRGIDTSPEQHRLIASIIAMARGLGILTLAEGVETAGEEAVLRAVGCDEIQGFRIARPMDEAAATAWLAGRADGGPRAPEDHSGGDRITP